MEPYAHEHWRLGLQLADQKNWSAAEKEFSAALDLTSYTSDIRQILADMACVLERQGKLGDAIDLYDGMCARHPGDIGFVRGYLESCFKAGRYEDALAAADQLQEKHPERAPLYTVKAVLYDQTGFLQ